MPTKATIIIASGIVAGILFLLAAYLCRRGDSVRQDCSNIWRCIVKTLGLAVEEPAKEPNHKLNPMASTATAGSSVAQVWVSQDGRLQVRAPDGAVNGLVVPNSVRPVLTSHGRPQLKTTTRGGPPGPPGVALPPPPATVVSPLAAAQRQARAVPPGGINNGSSAEAGAMYVYGMPLPATDARPVL